MTFDDVSMLGTCEVCGSREAVVVVSSAYGPVSFAYCKHCFENGLEPYSAMVSYVACAGNFPDDINEHYQKDVRRILKALNIDEQKFIDDVKETNKRMEEEMKQAESMDGDDWDGKFH